MHDIELKSETPIYVKQFKIQEDQQEAVQGHVEELLKLKVVRPSNSKFKCSSWPRRTEASKLFKTSGQSTNKPWWTSTP